MDKRGKPSGPASLIFLFPHNPEEISHFIKDSYKNELKSYKSDASTSR